MPLWMIEFAMPVRHKNATNHQSVEGSKKGKKGKKGKKKFLPFLPFLPFLLLLFT